MEAELRIGRLSMTHTEAFCVLASPSLASLTAPDTLSSRKPFLMPPSEVKCLLCLTTPPECL